MVIAPSPYDASCVPVTTAASTAEWVRAEDPIEAHHELVVGEAAPVAVAAEELAVGALALVDAVVAHFTARHQLLRRQMVDGSGEELVTPFRVLGRCASSRAYLFPVPGARSRVMPSQLRY